MLGTGGGRPGLLELGSQFVRTVAVLGGFGGRDVDERLQVGRVCRRVLRLALELCFEPVDLGAGGGGLVFGGTRVALDAGEEGFDLGDAGGGAFLCGRRSGSRLVELGLELLGPAAVLGGFGAGDVEERLEVGGGDRGSVGVLLQLRLEFGGVLAGLVAGGARLVAFGLEPVGAVAMALEFGRRGIEARLEIGGGSGGSVGVLPQLGFELGGPRVGGGCDLGGVLGGLAGLLVELCFEPVDLGAGVGGLVFGGTRVALDAGEEGFDLGDAGGGAFLCGRRSGSRLVELGLELLGPGAVLGGFGAGDVEERLEVGGGDRGSVGVLLQLRFEFGGALSGLVAGGARLVAFGLEPVGAVAMALEFGRVASRRAWRSAAAVAAASVCCRSWASSSVARCPAWSAAVCAASRSPCSRSARSRCWAASAVAISASA